MAHIKTYARIKPTGKPSKLLDYESNNVSISVPQLQPSGQTRDRTATLTHQFGFAGVFGPTSTQDEVFDSVAAHIVDGFLSGYNGTIFAYGQTGSGKTHTIEGGAKSYSERGLAPRALSRIYKSLEDQKFDDLSVKVSYLEIYQEVGYDLLNPTTRPGNVVTHLPKVSVTDGPNNSCLVRNLSMHLAADERVAQSLLVQGQASRKVAETPMNQRSSRSHAVFTIYLKARKKGSPATNKSKLHLVDLAGSERVAKTKIAGQQLHEAKSINLSLHHLEGVIIALQGGGQAEGSRVKGRRRAASAGPVRNRRIGSASSTRSLPYHRSMSMGGHRHIPYRNSLLTMVLRDSLGGNCLTAMIATISADALNLGESLSTCRFAMRVAAIQNKISRNEIIDDQTIIARLRRKIVLLEEEILSLKERLRDGSNMKDSSSNSPPHQHHKPSDSSAPLTPPAATQTKAPSSLADRSMPVVAPANGSSLTREGRQMCARVMHGFISGRVTDPIASGVSDFARFRECLRILREMIHRSYAYHQKYNPTLPSGGQGSKVKDDHVQEAKKTGDGGSMKFNSRPSNEKSHSKGYKSPFERKRDKEISRLGKTVESQRAEQRQQRRDLMEFKTLLKQQQLENAIIDLSNKISTTSNNLTKQRELVASLRQCKAGREQITAERVAEKQLAKRLAKYEKRYDLAHEHLQIVKNHLELQDRVNKARQSNNQGPHTRDAFIRLAPSSQSEATSHPMAQTSSPNHQTESNHPNTQSIDQSDVQLARSSVESDQSGGLTDRLVERCRHKSGRVNSRRVLDILQQEESKQKKVAEQLKKERIKNFTQHYALKEEATLSKLQHFKEQLRKQQEVEKEQSDHALNMNGSCDDHVKTAWSENVTTGKSSINQSEAGQMDTILGTVEAYGDHVNIALSDGISIVKPATHTPVDESDIVINSGRQNLEVAGHVKQPPMKYQQSFIPNDFEIQHSDTSGADTPASNLHASTDLSPSAMSSDPPSVDRSSSAEPAPGHSAALLSNKAPGSLELTDQSAPQPRRSSFDVALSSMLGPDRSKVTSGWKKASFGSEVTPTGSEDGKTKDKEDVTSALKSKLLDYLGGKPNRGPPIGSMSSLQDNWSRSSIRAGLTSSSSDVFTGSAGSSAFSGSPGNSPTGMIRAPSIGRMNSPTSIRSDLTGTSSDTFVGSAGSSTLSGSQATSASATLRVPSVGSMGSLQDTWSMSSSKSGFTSFSTLDSAFKQSSRSAFTESSVNTARTESSDQSAPTGVLDHTAFKTSSPNSLLGRSLIPNDLEISSMGSTIMGQSSINGVFEDSPVMNSGSIPNFQMGFSRSTLNSIGEEDSIVGRKGGESRRESLQSNLSVRSLDSSHGNVRSEVKAMEEGEGQRSYLSAARENKERIERIRKAVSSAKVIQRAWKKYRSQRK